jgi:sugar phosphate isomerase/epimerase
MHYTRMTGIADEGGASIAEQIANHVELGWDTIELRNVDGKNICEMDDGSFDAIRAAMEKAGLQASGFGSAIANWARPIGTPFERDLEDLRRAVPRMRALGTRFIRIMSYPNDGRDEVLWKKEVFRRIKELVTVADGEGIVLLHENCDGWASAKPERLAELLSFFDSPALRIVFDTGNPIGHGGSVEDTWAFYRSALPYISHFHIKDCKRLTDGKLEHVMPGDGDCDVVAIMRDLLGTGYAGLFSIEPHIAVQVHLGGRAVQGVDLGDVYREYGRRAKRIWDSLMTTEA